MTITPEQERALLNLYDDVKLCDETYEWHPNEDTTSYFGPTSLALLMWRAMDDAYEVFGYEPRTNRAVVSLEHIDDVIAEERAERAAKAKP